MSRARGLQATATKLLTQFDESDGRIKLVRKAVPSWDATEGAMVFGPDETFDLVGVTVPFSAGLVNGTTIQTGDLMAIVTATTEPKLDDKMMIDGVQWSIVDEPKTQYTGVAIVYKIHCRK